MKHFTFFELTRTNVALPNVPSPADAIRLYALTDNVLDPARELVGKPITINSGFRSPAVNQKVGGATTSQHLRGEAADLACADNALLYRLIRDNLKFDQLIWEKGNDTQPAWVHVSYREGNNRMQTLRIK